MKVLEMRREASDVRPLSLDDLWHEAEQIGRIEVDHEIGGAAYRVQIRFNSRGSLVWATGRDTSIQSAVAKAIEEARRLTP